LQAKHHIASKAPHCKQSTTSQAKHHIASKAPHRRQSTTSQAKHHMASKAPHCKQSTTLHAKHHIAIKAQHCKQSTTLQAKHHIASKAQHCKQSTTLQTRLSKKTYADLESYLTAKGLPITDFHSLKPSIVALTITLFEYQENGFTQEGVDKIFAKRAREDGKKVDWFESIDEQLDFLANMASDDDDSLIKYTLEELESLPRLIDDMFSSWLVGDLENLNTTMIEEMAVDFPQIYEDLIVKRNNNWMPKIIQLLNDQATEFVLVGAAHFAGKDSIFAKLEALGFKIEKVML
jgi:uncharacterized protein YbaP (TraB family)